MSNVFVVISCALLLQALASVAHADDDFYGIIESRPDGKAGTWIVGGRSIQVTERTDIDEDDGPFKVGACAEVETENGAVEEIESEPLRKCGN